MASTNYRSYGFTYKSAIRKTICKKSVKTFEKSVGRNNLSFDL